MSELLECPFCGSVRAPEVSDVGECEECSKFDDCGRRLENRTCEGCDRWERPMFVVCNYNISGCGASGPYRKTEAEAIAAWNSRAERTCENKSKSGTSFWCSKCDAATSDGFADIGGKLARFNHCPNCGRRCI